MRIMEKRVHLPVEIFGFVPEDKSKIAQKYRASKICPFITKLCVKQEYRTKRPPTGACVVSHLGEPHIICPKRFYGDDFRILWNAIRLTLGPNIEAVLIPEVELKRSGTRKKIGRIDWVGARLGSGGEIEDFIGIEAVSNQTTGKLTDALEEFNRTGEFSKTHYKYSLNTYMQIKTFFTQCLAKGRIFNKWSKKYIWIMQDFLFEDWTTRFNLKLERGTDRGNFIFMVQALFFDEKIGRYRLKQKEAYSATYEQLLEAYTAPVAEPFEIDDFLNIVKARIPAGMKKSRSRS